jgi:hypothetical protein
MLNFCPDPLKTLGAAPYMARIDANRSLNRAANCEGESYPTSSATCAIGRVVVWMSPKARFILVSLKISLKPVLSAASFRLSVASLMLNERAACPSVQSKAGLSSIICRSRSSSRGLWLWPSTAPPSANQVMRSIKRALAMAPGSLVKLPG